MSLEKAADALSAALVDLVRQVIAESGGAKKTETRGRKSNADKEAAAADKESSKSEGRSSRDDEPRASRDRDDDRPRARDRDGADRGRDDRDADRDRGRDRDDRDRPRDRDDRRDDRSRDDKDDRKSSKPMTIQDLRDAYGEYLGTDDEKEAKIRGDFASDMLEHFRVKKIGEIDDRDIDEAYDYLVSHKRGDKVRFKR